MRQDIIERIRVHEVELSALGVDHLSLFGSSARGDAGPDSDIDIVIDVDPSRRFSLLDQAGVRLFLCDILRRETGVVIRQDLQLAFLHRISQDEVSVF